MSRQNRKYTTEFKQEAVRLMETSGKPVVQIARDLGLNDNLLYKWRQEYGRREPAKTVDEMNAVELAAELKRLRRENEVLRQERDILKKAISILGPERE